MSTKTLADKLRDIRTELDSENKKREKFNEYFETAKESIINSLEKFIRTSALTSHIFQLDVCAKLSEDCCGLYYYIDSDDFYYFVTVPLVKFFT